jgi:catabolite regulation protein CreA
MQLTTTGKSLKNRLMLVTLTAAAMASTAAHAAIDASVSTAFEAVKTDAVALAAIVTPIVVAILGLALVIKLIKRFGNKI